MLLCLFLGGCIGVTDLGVSRVAEGCLMLQKLQLLEVAEIGSNWLDGRSDSSKCKQANRRLFDAIVFVST